jgi:hypothetical protein
MLLARKIEAVTGLPWQRGYDKSDYLMTDYQILYGGINSDTVTKRLSVPNGVMASVAWRMANETSCYVAGWDFYQPKAARKLFPLVEPGDAPETAGVANPEAIARIKENIVYLHDRILGETLSVDSAEVERTYGLFFETWKEGQALILDDSDIIGDRLNYRCQVREDRITGEEFGDGARLEMDEQYTIRSWMAVLTYLLSDYDFLYE